MGVFFAIMYEIRMGVLCDVRDADAAQRKGGSVKNRFAVFRNRSDLPEMTLPLAAAVLFFAVGSAVLAAKLPALGTAGMFLSPVMTVLSVVWYVLLIILWRKVAAMAVTPFSAVCMLCADVSVFAMTVASLGTLFLAYTMAVSVLSREGRYRRILTASLAASVTMLLGAAAWVGMHYESPDAFLAVLRESIQSLIRNSYETVVTSEIYTQSLSAGVPVTVTESDVSAEAASVMGAIPAYFVMAGLLTAWLADGLTRFFLVQLDAIDDFLPPTHRITLPKAYAAVHIAVTLLMTATSPVHNPLLYAVLRSLFLSMVLPCLYIGCVKLRRGIMIRLYFIHGKRTLSLFLMIFTVMLIGVSNFVVFFSLSGSVFVLRFHRKIEKRLCDNM